jgi:hypothetical protein
VGARTLSQLLWYTRQGSGSTAHPQESGEGGLGVSVNLLPATAL